MNILIIGFKWWGSLVNDIVYGFQKFNCKVDLLNCLIKPATPVKALYKGLYKLNLEKYFYLLKFNKVSEKINYEVNHYNILKQIKQKKYDLIFIIKSEKIKSETIKYIKKKYNIPVYVYSIDNPFFEVRENDLELRKETIEAYEYFDRIFVFDSYFIPLLESHFSNKIYHLPFFFNKEKYSQISSAKKYDVSFIGLYFKIREEILKQLKAYKLIVAGPGWQKIFPENFYKEIVRTEETNYIYNQTKVNININHKQSINGTNTRTFEVVGSGNFLISDYKEDLEELFEIGKEIEVYKTKEELKDKVKYYLNNYEKAEKIAKTGQKKALEKHTVEKRIEYVLKIYEQDKK